MHLIFPIAPWGNTVTSPTLQVLEQRTERLSNLLKSTQHNSREESVINPAGIGTHTVWLQNASLYHCHGTSLYYAHLQ